MPSSPIERKLAEIMFTDIASFTKIMGDDETTALSILENQQSLINPIVKERKGTIIKKMGDGLLIEGMFYHLKSLLLKLKNTTNKFLIYPISKAIVEELEKVND